MARHDASGWEIKHCPHCPILSLQIVRTCDLGSFLHSDTTLRSWSSLCGASSADGSVAPIESSDLVGFVILGESRTKSGPKIWFQLKWILTICKRNFAGLLFWSLIWSILHMVSQGRLFIVETLLFNAFSTFQQKESVETVGFRANPKKIHGCTVPLGQPSWSHKIPSQKRVHRTRLHKRRESQARAWHCGDASKKGGLCEDCWRNTWQLGKKVGSQICLLFLRCSQFFWIAIPRRNAGEGDGRSWKILLVGMFVDLYWKLCRNWV